jgi:type 1 glutamine amidotransferase
MIALSSLILVLSTAFSPEAPLAPPAHLPRIVLIAGAPSHGPGDHEHRAGMLLLEACLKQVGGVETVLVDLAKGWPKPEVFEGAKAIAIFSDGRGGHPFLSKDPASGRDHMDEIGRLMSAGVGLVCLHYAVDFPKEVGPRVLEWLGGYYEDGYSTNPHNHVEVTPASPAHPISRGLAAYTALDEWYYRIRFDPKDARVTPILAMVPKDKPDQGRQVIAWATERKDGGRAFGFTGGHFHRNWGIEEFRRMVLNALLWTAGVEVPAGGVKSTVTEEALKANLDKKG